MDLMLVESPNKIKTISQYIQSTDCVVIATYGHIRSLSKFGMGFNVENFEINWQNDKSKKIKFENKEIQVIDLIKKLSKKSNNIFLATDPDREGEAIAWHVFSILDEKEQKKCKRIVFNEITQQAIQESFKHARGLDYNQIFSYLARRLLDRLIGYKLSWYTKKKINGISAGRVQSIALKFLKDKEEEIKKFVPESWYKIDLILEKDIPLTLKTLNAKYKNFKINKKVSPGFINFEEKESAQELIKNLSDEYLLTNISEDKFSFLNPPKSFKTSTLLCKAIRVLHTSSKNIVKLLQTLYEGVEIDGQNVSLITYPRTDRTDFSNQFLDEAKKFIVSEFSKDYLNTSPAPIKKSELTQGAHEGIRPTNINFSPHTAKLYLNAKEHKLYELIWKQTVESLMSPAKIKNVYYQFTNDENIFQNTQNEIIFSGFQELNKKYKFSISIEETRLQESFFKLSKKYKKKKIEIKKVDKAPPARYNEASLIKALESKGIGRPSTYSSIANVVLDRNYAEKNNNNLQITELGEKVSSDLEQNFINFINYDFTKKMESDLDNIAKNKKKWTDFLNESFKVFDIDYQKANKTIVKKEYEKVEGEVCPKCESELIYRFNSKTNEKFMSCSGYPKCKYAKSIINKDNILDKNCIECEKPLRKIKNKYNKFFIACTGYPECKYIEKQEKKLDLINEYCPHCNAQLCNRIGRRNTTFIACTGFPKCKYIKKDNSIKSAKKNTSPKTRTSKKNLNSKAEK